MGESLHHILGDCRELRELHLEIFGREVGGRGRVLKILGSRY